MVELKFLAACCRLIQQRYVMAFFGFTAVINAYTMRSCLSMTLIRIAGKARMVDPGTHTFDWSHAEQGFVLSSFYVGYLIMHLPGGMLADKFGGKWVLALGILWTSILTLLTPSVIDSGGLYWLMVWRILIGIGEGVTFPALGTLVSSWIPLRERAKCGALIFGGGQIGTVVGFYVTALLMDAYKDTWSPAYYVYGTAGVLWTILFLLFVFNDANSHPYISDGEKDYLQQEMGQLQRSDKLPFTPWLHMLRSKPLWALIIAQFGHDWGFYAMNSDLNKYYHDVLHFETKNNGLYSALPFLVMWVISVGSGILCDWMINSGCMPVTNARIWFTSVGAIGPAIFLIAASYAGTDKTTVVVLVTIGVGLLGLFYPGLKVNGIDLSPNYAGSSMGLVNGIGSTAGIIAPAMAGLLTPHSNLVEWRTVFWVAFAVLVATSVVFIIWGSGVVQPWNEPDPNDRSTQDCCNRWCFCCKHGPEPEPQPEPKKGFFG